MNNAKSTPESFTVRLGHPVFIFFWSVWMVVLGVVLGVHLHPSRIPPRSAFRSYARR